MKYFVIKDIYILLVFFLVTFKFLAQENKLKILEDVLIPISNTSVEEPLSNSTKQKLKKIFADVEIVGLGENTHEDGATFREKIKLIKFLHEEMGFNVLAFESSFYGSWLTNEAYKSNPTNVYEVSQFVGSWVKGKSSYPIYEYMANSHKTKNPLIIAGFDGEKLPYAKSNMTNFYKEIKKLIGYKTTEQQDIQVDSLFTGIFTGFAGKPAYDAMKQTTKKSAIHVIDTLQILLRQIDSVKYKDRILFTKSILMENHENEDFSLWNMRRDHNMGKRIFWLKNVMYPDEKIILWAASGHLMRNSIGIDREDTLYPLEPIYQAGDYIYNTFGDKYYALFFTSGNGFIGNTFPEGHKWKQHEQTQVLKNFISRGSFEDIASQVNREIFIVDFRSQNQVNWLKNRFTAHPLGYNKDTALWHKIVDGFYFIKNMEPNHINK